MATPTATAKRQQAAAARALAAAAALGLQFAQSKQRDPQVQIAELLENMAAMLESMTAPAQPAADSQPAPKKNRRQTDDA